MAPQPERQTASRHPARVAHRAHSRTVSRVDRESALGGVTESDPRTGLQIPSGVAALDCPWTVSWLVCGSV